LATVTSVTPATGTRLKAAYLTALTDWLACACGGCGEPAARAVRDSDVGLLADVAYAATAGHVLDYDDTFSPGVTHVSAPTAPAALVLAAHLGLPVSAAVEAYVDGYEALAAVAADSHPALYDGGWHPTAVCGGIGAAVAAGRLLGLTDAQRGHAVALAVLRAGGTRGAFGSDAKAIQVGFAAAHGVQAARLAQAGATVGPRAIHGPLGFEGVLGATLSAHSSPPDAPDPRPQPRPDHLHERPARGIDGNWIKLHPSCLGTHSPIDAAERARQAGYELGREPVTVVVHPRARQAAHLDAVSDGLAAKFSIPYCVAYTLRHGPPGVRDFGSIDPATAQLAEQIAVTLQDTLPEFGAVLMAGERELVRVDAPAGSPERPVTAAQLAAKLAELAGQRLDRVLDDLAAPALGALTAAGLRCSVS
jgi:2-methylcitrate dehydratase PrpD